MQKGITIGRWDFPNKQAALNHCRAILYRDELSTKLEGEDAEFIETLFWTQMNQKLVNTDIHIIGFYRDVHKHRGPCFFTLTSKGEKMKFSAEKAITIVAHKSSIL